MIHQTNEDFHLRLARDFVDYRAESARAAKLEAEALQVLAANGIFAWYGMAADWAVPSSATTEVRLGRRSYLCDERSALRHG